MPDGKPATFRAGHRWAFSMPQILLILVLLGVTGCKGLGPGVIIDYVDFIRVGGISYIAAWTSPGRPLQEGDLGPVFAKVKIKLEGSQDPQHQTQDGDAGFLDSGTSVFQVKGYRPSFRLAAHSQGRITLYEADTNPKAKVGADLLDLAGKVGYIGINSSHDGRTELGAIRDRASLDTLVSMVLKASVDQASRSPAGVRYFVDFHLLDGTETTRSYWPQGGELSRGILLPPAFALAVTSAVSAGPTQPASGHPAGFGPVQLGVAYAFRLYTHCGPDWRTSFDGTYWDLAAPVGSGLDNPYQDGTMTLIAADQAAFEYVANGGPGRITFRRHVEGAPLKEPAGCD